MKIQERTGAGAGRSAAPVQPPVGDRLPSPPRERKPALAALAVLLILVGALGATMLVLRAGDRVEVIKVTAEIQAGESIGDKVTPVMVADDDSINYVKWSQLDALKALKARSTIYKDTVVMGQMFAKGESLPAGKASVGLALKEGQYPTGIKPGDVVAAYRVGANGASSSGSSDSSDRDASSSASGGAIVSDARVTGVTGEGDATLSTGNTGVTVLVDEADAAALASAAAAGEVAVVRVPGK
ncbi:hypothetical protein [Streptomyces lancefieldiae]|uniref:SAF domain-containing protein n=1 Tax=Streptomyces lancefieldiae TaxID=3075520 RepID=A0ABU3AVK1_9ACTN|nr:hypothetical protein [Streptomyces sp. DSM 40712]MDT0614230.1 hypothetical protein [Streptomyces sp. DSM 40712]